METYSRILAYSGSDFGTLPSPQEAAPRLPLPAPAPAAAAVASASVDLPAGVFRCVQSASGFSHAL